MTTDQMLAVLAERGLAIVLREDGSPVLRGDKNLATATLMRALQHHKEEIVRRLRPQPAPIVTSRARSENCPRCQQRLDRHSCWKCSIAVCEECGRTTESPFLIVCRPCEVANCQRQGLPY